MAQAEGVVDRVIFSDAVVDFGGIMVGVCVAVCAAE